jgi:DNA-directed RNA polymerase subunit RPC12/RpoP
MDLRIEPDLMYCPRCNDEYRAGFSICAACNIELISGLEIMQQQEQTTHSSAGDIQPGEVLIAIRQGSVVEIKQLQAQLKRSGIASITTGDAATCGKGCGGGKVILQVRESDMKRVQAILQEDYIRSTSLAEHDLGTVGEVVALDGAEATCPACGSRFVPNNPECPDCGLCFA